MLTTPPLSLYVHLPWCVRKCPYCDFNSHEGRGALPFVAYVDALIADLEATPREAVVQVLRDVMQFNPHPALARYQGPALSIVTPQNDMPMSLHRLGKGLPHRIVTGTGHWIQLDKPEEFNRLLDEFLAQDVSGKGRA